MRAIMRQWRKVNLDSLVSGYVEAALWSSTICTNEQDENGDYIDIENGDGLQFSPSGYAAMRSRVAATLSKLDNRRLFRVATLRGIKRDGVSAYLKNTWQYNQNQFGHDLWLTENGHGTGFWDRNSLNFTLNGCTDTLGDMLTDAVRYREACLYLDDDGMVGID